LLSSDARNVPWYLELQEESYAREFTLERPRRPQLISKRASIALDEFSSVG
jgi:hypothetical protein